MGAVLAIAVIPFTWWLGGVGLAWLVALLRPDTLRSGVCKHCAYDRSDVHGYLPCPECGLSIAEARRRIPRLPRPRQCLAAALTTLVVPLAGLVAWLTPSLAGLFGTPGAVFAGAVLIALVLVCLALPFGWAHYAEHRFMARLSSEIGWSFVIGPAVGAVVGLVFGVTIAALEGDPDLFLLIAVAGCVYGAVAGVGLGPAWLCVWLLTSMYARALMGDKTGDTEGTARPMKMLH